MESLLKYLQLTAPRTLVASAEYTENLHMLQGNVSFWKNRATKEKRIKKQKWKG